MPNPAQAERRNSFPVGLIVLDALAFAGVAGALILVIFFTPREAVMGDVQKVFYFHVSSAWVGMLGFFMAFIAGLGTLRTRKPFWDAAGVAGVEIGLVFTLLAIISGSIWARPIWNTWWTWDPRLTTAFVMLLVYAAYFILRNSLEESEKKARISAVYAIIGFISVPFTFVSIRLFRTIHPVLFGAGSGGEAFQMSPKMLFAFMLSLTAFTLLFAVLYWHRLRFGLAQQALSDAQSLQDDEEPL